MRSIPEANELKLLLNQDFELAYAISRFDKFQGEYIPLGKVDGAIVVWDFYKNAGRPLDAEELI